MLDVNCTKFNTDIPGKSHSFTFLLTYKSTRNGSVLSELFSTVIFREALREAEITWNDELTNLWKEVGA